MEAIQRRLDALERRNAALVEQNESVLARASLQSRHIARLERRLAALETDSGHVDGGWEESWVGQQGSSLVGVETGDGRSWRWKPKASTKSKRAFDFARIPGEVVTEILRFASPSDLAVFCRVSFACLELAGSELYRHSIYLHGLEGLLKMFCPRPKSLYGTRLLNPLSVQHVRHLTIYIPHHEPLLDDGPDPSTLEAHTGRLETTLYHPPFFFALKTLYLVFDHNTTSIPRPYHRIIKSLGHFVKTVILRRRTTPGVNRLSSVAGLAPIYKLFPELCVIVQWGAYFSDAQNFADPDALEADTREGPSSPFRNIFLLDGGQRKIAEIVEDVTVALLNSGSVRASDWEEDETGGVARSNSRVPEIWGGREATGLLERELGDTLEEMGDFPVGTGTKTVCLKNWDAIVQDDEAGRLYIEARGDRYAQIRTLFS